MRLLVLGGTWFLGRVLAESAVRRGWEVTCFNRGRSGRDVDGVEAVRGDRTVPADLERLAARGRWDAVVDTGAYEPVGVQLTAGALYKAVDRYLVVSTVSAYRDWPARPVTEDSALWPGRSNARDIDPDIAELPGPFAYGTLKTGCEHAVREVFGDGGVVLRPGVVLGPYEYVGRLDALLSRASRGGRMLVGGVRDRFLQPVDVRDLAEFMLRLISSGQVGAFNVVAPKNHATYGGLIDACVDVTGNGSDPVWVDPSWLVERGVREWTELVLWRSAAGTWDVNGDRARAAGLVCRPLRNTVADTWDWLGRDGPVPHPRAGDHGLSIDKEKSLLAEWDALARHRG